MTAATFDHINERIGYDADLINMWNAFERYLQKKGWPIKKGELHYEKLKNMVLSLVRPGFPGALQHFSEYNYEYNLPFHRRKFTGNLLANFKDFLPEHIHSRNVSPTEKQVAQGLARKLESVPTVKNVRTGMVNLDDTDTVVLDRIGGSKHSSIGAAIEIPKTFKKSTLRSTLSSFAVSALIGSTSRLAIAAAIGGSAGVIPAAIIGGVAAGAFTSYWRNRHTIGALVEKETTWKGRMKARWRGFSKTYSVRQFMFNSVGSVAGLGVGALASDLVAYAAEQNIFENLHLAEYLADRQQQLQQSPMVASLVDAFSTSSPAVETASAVITPVDASVTEAIMPAVNDVPYASQAEIASVFDKIEPAAPAIEAAVSDGLESVVPNLASLTNALDYHQANTLMQRLGYDISQTMIYTAETPELSVPKGEFNTAGMVGPMSYAPELPASPSPFDSLNLAETPYDTGTEYNIKIDSIHSVESGDRLWRLAESLGAADSAESYREFIEKVVAANAEQYPELLDDPNHLTVGWDLQIPNLDETTARASCKMAGGRYTSCTLGG